MISEAEMDMMEPQPRDARNGMIPKDTPLEP